MASSCYSRRVDVIHGERHSLRVVMTRRMLVIFTGCTWTFEILTMLLKGKAEGPQFSKMHVMLEASSADNLDDIVSPRLLNTHLPYRRYS